MSEMSRSWSRQYKRVQTWDCPVSIPHVPTQSLFLPCEVTTGHRDQWLEQRSRSKHAPSFLLPVSGPGAGFIHVQGCRDQFGGWPLDPI